MEITQRLKNLRKELGITQQEVAENLGILKESYRRWEIGKSNPSKQNLEKLSKFYNVSTSYLLGETDVRSSSDFMERMANLSEAQQEDVIKFLQKQEDTTSAHQEKNSSNSPQKKR